jgi:hypothetical protein
MDNKCKRIQLYGPVENNDFDRCCWEIFAVQPFRLRCKSRGRRRLGGHLTPGMPLIKCSILLVLSSSTLAGRDVVWHLAAPVPCEHARMIAAKAAGTPSQSANECVSRKGILGELRLPQGKGRITHQVVFSRVHDSRDARKRCHPNSPTSGVANMAQSVLSVWHSHHIEQTAMDSLNSNAVPEGSVFANRPLKEVFRNRAQIQAILSRNTISRDLSVA